MAVVTAVISFNERALNKSPYSCGPTFKHRLEVFAAEMKKSPVKEMNVPFHNCSVYTALQE